MIRKNGFADYTFDATTGTLKWTFVGNVEPIVYTIPKWTSYSPFIQSMLVNGAKQKIADAGALSDATVEMKIDAMRECAGNLKKGIWNAGRDGNALLFRAACALNPTVDVKKVRAWFDGLDAATKRAIERKPEYRDQMDKMRPAADASIADAALAELSK